MDDAGAMNRRQGTRRPIRSYVVRSGRLTASQAKAIERLWPLYGLEAAKGTIDPERIFGRRAELVLEIGFGMGEALLEMARAHPERDFIGVDVHAPGVGAVLRGVHEQSLHNVRVFQHDAVEVLARCFTSGSLDRVLIFFPDPWPKKRHHKRRLIQPPFAEVVHAKLAPGGILHMATDWADYAEHIKAVMAGARGFRNRAGPGRFAEVHDRPLTKFERRGQRLGHDVWDMVFEKTD